MFSIPLPRTGLMLLVLLILAIGIHGTAEGQVPVPPAAGDAVPPGGGRQNPAPWRPAFGDTSLGAGTPPSFGSPAVAAEKNQDPMPNGSPEPASQPGPQSQPLSTQASVRSPGNPAANPAAPPPTQEPQQPDTGAAPNRSTELTDNTRSAPGWQSNPAAGAASGFTVGPVQAPYGAAPPREDLTSVAKTFDALPNGAGQIWREYDLQPYTSRITGTNHPEKAVVDWLLRQTGRQMWFQEPFGFMNASRDRLIVYHTPEIHNQLRPLLDRMMNNRGQPQVLELGLYTVANPNWRAVALPTMQPIEVNSPGVEAWVVSKENAARLISQLSGRADFRSHASGRAITHDGQEFSLERRAPEQFVRTIQWTPGQGSGYQPVLTQFLEGYTISVSPLTELGGRTIEVAIECSVDQIERQTTVQVPVTDAFGVTQRVNLQIPQVVSWQLEERVRWPVDQVLIMSCGVVALPDAEKVNRPLGGLLDPASRRADALLFLDYRGPTTERPDGSTAQRQDLAPIQRN